MLQPPKDVPDWNCWNHPAQIRASVSCGYLFARKSPRNTILKEKRITLISVFLFDVSSELISSISKLKQECSKPTQKSYNLAVTSSKSPKQQVLQGNVLLSGMKNKWQRDMAEPIDINA